ncbi:hypothetical protein FKM82_011661 [Ascaphus truei]
MLSIMMIHQTCLFQCLIISSLHLAISLLIKAKHSVSFTSDNSAVNAAQPFDGKFIISYCSGTAMCSGLRGMRLSISYKKKYKVNL